MAWPFPKVIATDSKSLSPSQPTRGSGLHRCDRRDTCVDVSWLTGPKRGCGHPLLNWIGKINSSLHQTSTANAMDPLVARLKTLADCEAFADNVRERGKPELADQARKRAVQIRADAHGAETNLERECLQAVYAYEEVLSAQRGRRQPAARTWQMIKRRGIAQAVEHVVTNREVTAGFTVLAEMGLMEYAFEAVILRYPDNFSAEAIAVSKKRLERQ